MNTTGLATRCTAKIATLATIALSTGAAWVAYESICGAGVNAMAIDVARGLGRLGGNVGSLDPIVTMVVLPIATLGALALASLFVWNRLAS